MDALETIITGFLAAATAAAVAMATISVTLGAIRLVRSKV